MRVFHFVNETFGLSDIAERRLKIARLHELNDPFEFLGVELSNPGFRRAMKQSKETLSSTNGLLCFSRRWSNPVLWSHYANKHQGICLGFDIPDAFLHPVSYVNSRFSAPEKADETFVRKLLFTKFAHWSYEDEYRVYEDLDTQENGMYFADFSPEIALRQVIVGCESTISRAELSTALGTLAGEVEVFKARAAFRSFRIVRNKNAALWV